MKKALTDTQLAVYSFLKHKFKKGESMTYAEIADRVGTGVETARQAVIALGSKVKRKDGHIVSVK